MELQPSVGLIRWRLTLADLLDNLVLARPSDYERYDRRLRLASELFLPSRLADVDKALLQLSVPLSTPTVLLMEDVAAALKAVQRLRDQSKK